jgi:FixJ family two-component response regulator
MAASCGSRFRQQRSGHPLKVPHSDLEPTVVVIDDDQDIREALEGLMRSIGLRVELFASPQEFLDRAPQISVACFVFDVRLPGQSGLDFHDELLKAHMERPVVFISGHADIQMSVRAMKAGAVEFLTKPIRPQDLLDAIQFAIGRDRAHRDAEARIAELRAQFDSLTPREREVMTLVAAGRANKQIAWEIGVTLATVKLHRGQIMRKMRAQSLADLVRMADKLNLSP